VNQHLLKLLLSGEYICPVTHGNEYLLLLDEEEKEAVDDWLLKLGMRVARVSDEGAFFLAHDYVGQKEVTQLKSELLNFRDMYGPAVLMLDLIRQAEGGRIQLSPGEFIMLYKLEEAVAQSSMLETQLKGLLGVITNAAMRNSNHENLRKLLEHLARDGYVKLTNKDQGSYQVTGKIEQLYAVLQFLDENKVVSDAEVDDREVVQDDLVDQAHNDEEQSQ
jgi:predicted transcriptional regulator